MICRENNHSIYRSIFSWCVALGGALSLAVCLLCNLEDKKIIAFLPLSYLCCFFAFRANRQKLHALSLSIINIVAFCRYIVYPAIIAITLHRGDYYPFDKACVWIMAYELVGVFCVIGLFARKIQETGYERFRNYGIGLPNFALACSFVPICVLFPSLLTRFSIDSSTRKMAGTIGIVEVVFTMAIWTLFIFLITRIANEKRHRLLSLVCVIAIAAYYVMFNAISGGNVKRWQIICCGIAMMYIAIGLFPEIKRKIILLGGVGILTFVAIGSLIKFGINDTYKSLIDQYFNAFHFTEYFGGMKNITIAVELFSGNNSLQGARSLFTDLFSGMPIISGFFDYEANSVIAMFQRSVGRTDIICPLAAQSVAYFGFAGTPILGMAMTYLAIKCNVVLSETKSYYCAYVLIELVVWTSLFMMLNTTIIMEKIWIRLMFLALQWADRRFVIKIKRGGTIEKA